MGWQADFWERVRAASDALPRDADGKVSVDPETTDAAHFGTTLRALPTDDDERE